MRTPIVSRARCRDQFEYMGRLTGQSSQKAINIALELTADMKRCSSYPPEHRAEISNASLVSAVDRIIDKIKLKPNTDT